MKLLIKQQILLAFVIALLILLALGFFAYRSSKSVLTALELEQHTQAVLLKLDELKGRVLDSETGVRGYLITGNENYLELQKNAPQKVKEHLSELQNLIANEPSQAAEIDNLEKLLQQKLDFLQELTDLRRQNGIVAASDKLSLGIGEKLMDEIRLSIGKMQEEERNLLRVREDELSNSISNTFGFLFFGMVGGIIALGFANFVIFREINKRNKAEEEIYLANFDLERRVEERTKEIVGKNEELNEQINRREYTENLHQLALAAGNLGTWILEQETESLTLDERMRAILGLGDDDCPGKKADFFRNIHSEDLEAIEEIFQKAAAENINIDARFRLATKDGSVRWVHCTGQPHNNGNGAFRFIGNCCDVTDQEEFANKLRDSEVFTRSVLDSLPAHIAVVNKEGEIVAVNRAWENFAEENCLPEHLHLTGIGQDYIEICKNIEVLKDGKNHILENLREVINGSLRHFSVEYPCHSPDQERWFIMNVNALNNENSGAVISHIDITDRKLAENELKNSEEFSRSIYENSPDCVKILELDGTLHSINDNGLCVMEIDDFREFKGKQWIDFWQDYENEMAYQAVKNAREGKSANFEGFCLTAKGNPKWWSVSIAPIFGSDGKPVRIISISRDITERRQAERIQAYLAAIVESSNNAIISKDLNGIITSWNKGAENLFGYTSGEAIGQPITLIIPPERIDEETHILSSIRQGKKIVSFETVRRRKDQTLIEISVTISPILDNAGNIIGASKTADDITQRKQIEAEREKLLKSEQAARKDAEIANRLRDEFLATVSHELRAPLNSILGWARLMEKGKLDENTMEKAISTIVRNSEAQNRLIEDLLDVSRIISGKLRLEVMTIKPILFVEAALETARPAAEAKNITLEIIEDPVVSHISGDPTRLQQVLWNLLSNAIKFTPKDGKVTVSISRPNGYIEISVKDTGVGIKEDFLPHVFDRFRQADASSIRKYGGLGLGLAIVRHITEMHGGTVRVESAGENQGSTFTISLPVISSNAHEDLIEINTQGSLYDENDPKLNLNGLLILVVDDEPDSCQLLVQSLTPHGATVITASSAAEGLRELLDKNPDVLVSDIGMPDEDGYSLIKKVRSLEDESLRNITAVALTAFTRAQDRMRALSAGFNNHVGKPVEPDELATVIASLTGKLEMGGED